VRRRLASGFWLLASGFWLLASGFWLLASGFWLLASGKNQTLMWPLLSHLIKAEARKDALTLAFIAGSGEG
jgi:hypothetical protein